MKTAFLSFLVACGAAASVMASPAAQSLCAACPTADNDGHALVAGSGGTLGVPKFCGYSADATGASGPQVNCFYNNGSGGLFSNSNTLCPPTALLVTCTFA